MSISPSGAKQLGGLPVGTSARNAWQSSGIAAPDVKSDSVTKSITSTIPSPQSIAPGKDSPGQTSPQL